MLKVFLFICLFLALLRGFSVGTDVEGYTENFMRMTSDPATWNYQMPFEPGFNVIILILKKAGNPMLCWGIISCVYIYGAYSFFRKYSKKANIAWFLFIAMGSYFLCYNIMRQCFALGIIMILVSKFGLLKNEKTIILIYILTILLCAFLFHSTMLILLIIPILNNKVIRQNFNSYVLIVFVIVSFFLGVGNHVADFIASLLGFGNIEGKFVNYAMQNIKTDDIAGYSTVRLLVNSLFCISLLYSDRRNETSLFRLLYVSSICFFNLFGNIVIEFARVGEVLLLWGIIYIESIYSGNIRYSCLNKCLIFLFSIVSYVNILLKGYGGIIPYTFDKNLIYYIFN